MAPPEDFDPTKGDSSMTDLQANQKALTRMFELMLLGLIILTGSLFVFFLREVSSSKRQLREISGWVAEQEKTTVPVMREFLTKLQAFSKANKDFAPILNKYMGGTNAPSADAGLSGDDSVRMPPPTTGR